MRGGEVLADRFEVEHLAGSGGMGDVYRARDLQTGQPVAIKVLTGQRAGDMARFDREVRILSSITHPRIVHYVTHGVLPSKDPYCVMEWLEGEDLSQRILRGPLPVADAVTIGIHAAEGLTVLHERGIMHRDIKPSNLYLVNRNIDEVKLLDLGIARSESSAKLTGTGMLLGTVAYMAPEQANGSATIDARTDIFSLGCVLFECLTGEVAFDGSNVMAILTKILFEDTPRLRQKTPHLPQALCALVERMLSKNPGERPNSARAVAQALRDLGSFSGTPWEQTLEVVGTYSITHSEQRAVALIFIGGRGTLANDEQLAFEATRHGGRFERLFDGSAAVMLVGPQVPTDLAAQAARCALALKRHTGRRHMALTMDRSEGRGPRTVGLAIDRAAKLVERENCTPATEEHVMLDNATVGLLDARFDVLEDSGIFVLRAERDIVEVRTLMGKPTPCLGRDRELRMLEEAYDDCVNDSTVRVILLTGAAGMGKSRIANELVHRIRSRDEPPSIWTARGELLGAGSALSMLAELVRRVCGIRTGESLEVRRNKLSVRVQLNVPARDQKRVTEFLGEIVGAHFSSDVSPALRAARKDPQLMGDQIRAAFEDFLRAECAAGPVFILLEDLHWGDGATIRILGTALAAVAEKSLFLLALGRPEVEDVFPRLWAERGLETRRLQQLAKKASEQLVRHVLGMNADSQTVERIVQLSDGNAFYLEELIRATVEGRNYDLPQAVVAMVQSRLAALAEENRRMLRAASIFGDTFWSNGLATLLGADADGTNTFGGVLRALVDAELITKRRESRFVGEDEYVFRHALIREAAYAMLTGDDKMLGHRLAGEWLEQHGEMDAVVLAGHFQQGGDREKAAKHFMRVTETANATGDSDTTIEYAKQGLACEPTADVRFALLGNLCEATAWKLNTPRELVPQIEEMLERTPLGSKQWLQGVFALSIFRFPQYGELARFFDKMTRVTPAPNAVSFFVFLSGIASAQVDFAGDIAHGDAILNQARRTALRHCDEPLVVANYSNRFAMRTVASGRGNIWKAFEHATDSSRLFQEIGHRRMFNTSTIMMGSLLWCLGQPDVALRTLEQPFLADAQLAYAGIIRNFARAWLRIERGELDEAELIARAFIQSPLQHLSTGPRGHWLMAEVCRRAGKLAAADEAVQIALETGLVIDQPGIQATLAAVRLAQGGVDDAVGAAEKGMAQYRTMNACGLCRAGYLRQIRAECLLAAGRLDDAKTALVEAKTWLAEIAATIGDQKDRDTFLNDVPENKRLLEIAASLL